MPGRERFLLIGTIVGFIVPSFLLAKFALASGALDFATFLVGICFGAPLYLLLRERAVRLSSD